MELAAEFGYTTSFTAAEYNHPVVIENHKLSMEGYRKRVEYALDAVRAALSTLDAV